MPRARRPGRSAAAPDGCRPPGTPGRCCAQRARVRGAAVLGTCVHSLMIARLRRRRDGRATTRADRRWTYCRWWRWSRAARRSRGAPGAPRCPRRCCWSRPGWSPRTCPGCRTTPSTRTSCCRWCCPRCCTPRPLDSSYLDLRANIRPIALLSVGYVLFATVAVGYVAYLLVPGLPLPAALVLGAVVAPPDAVAATAIARRLGLPHRITTILQGESLVNDATAITAYRVALAAARRRGRRAGPSGIGEFLLAAVGGVGVGLVLMVPIHWLRTHLKEPLLQNTLSLLIPFVAYAAAEQVARVRRARGRRRRAVPRAPRLAGRLRHPAPGGGGLEDGRLHPGVGGLRADRAAAAVRRRQGSASTRASRPPGTRSPSSSPWSWSASSGSFRRPSCRACCRRGSGSASRTPTGRRR